MAEVGEGDDVSTELPLGKSRGLAWCRIAMLDIWGEAILFLLAITVLRRKQGQIFVTPKSRIVQLDTTLDLSKAKSQNSQTSAYCKGRPSWFQEHQTCLRGGDGSCEEARPTASNPDLDDCALQWALNLEGLPERKNS